MAGATGSREYLKRMKEARKKLKSDDDEDDDEDENLMDEEEVAHDDENNEDFLDLHGNEELLIDDGDASTSKVKLAKSTDGDEEPKAENDKSEDDDDEPMASDQEKSFEKIDQQLEHEIRSREKRSRKRKPIEWSCVHCNFESTVIKVNFKQTLNLLNFLTNNSNIPRNICNICAKTITCE